MSPSLPTIQRRLRRTELIFMTVAIVAMVVYYAYPFAHNMMNETREFDLDKRTVMRGYACEKQRHQINVFMAAFFGGGFAADQWYARNFQLAIPKFLILTCGFCGVGLRFIENLTSVSPLFVWWLIDVVFWGIGFYTTGTNGNHFGNPTQQCAVIGW